MNFDPYTALPIHQKGIWESKCLQKEKQIQENIYDILQQKGWTQSNQLHRIWYRNNRSVVVCLVDDIRSCTPDYHTDLPYIFDERTLVVTDNYINCPTQYQVLNMPASMFGIYHCAGSTSAWQPDRLFSFSVNRIDQRRTKLMLELAKRVYVDKGYVNFNCQNEFDGNQFQGQQRLPANFEHYWSQLSDEDRAQWQGSYDHLIPRMPLKNYDCEHTDIFNRAWLNIDCETYSSDTSAAFSEKVFRLLTTPAPWMCYLGHYGVAYLQSLGFDCAADLVDHNHYDRLKEVESKIGIFVWQALKLARQFRDLVDTGIDARMQQAATHNRALLELYAARWPADFDAWLQRFSAMIE